VCQDCDDDVTAADAGDEGCCLLLGNNNWYLLIRLYYILCERLCYFHTHAESVMTAALAEQQQHPDTIETAYALCLKTPRQYSHHHHVMYRVM